MPRPRFEKMSPERREQMLEVAGKEFAQHGYDGASLNHILEAAGVSKGAAYYYFDDKADLFATVVRHTWADLLSAIDFDLAKVTRAGFWPAVVRLYRQGIVELKESPWMLGVAKSVWKLSKEAKAQKALGEIFASSSGFLSAFVRRGQEVGAIRTDLPTDLLVALIVGLDGAWDGWFLENLERLRPPETEEIALKLIDAARRMLEPPKGTRA